MRRSCRGKGRGGLGSYYSKCQTKEAGAAGAEEVVSEGHPSTHMF